jgi:ElaB/YqjD/DUF883 family membrane-anchored ribosome-binding protein
MDKNQKRKEDLQQDLQQLVADTKGLLNSTADISDKAAKTARAQVESSLRNVQSQFESGVSAAGSKIEEQLTVADQHIQANPYKTIGASFGIGLLLGVLIGKK